MNCDGLRILFVVLLAMAGGNDALAAKRAALVIGNDNYNHVTKLRKAVNDARAIDTALKALGFSVTRAENVDRREMNRRLQRFTSGLEPGDEALFFYAGHGVEIAGRNYLLPIDIPGANPGQDNFVKSEAIPVDRILGDIRERGTRVSILMLDACRDNPFPKSGTRTLGRSRGLGRMPATEGTFIMFSAGFGQTALDRLSNADVNANSVFTRSLIPLLGKPGLSLTALARQVRRNVQKLARTVSLSQRPAYYDEVTGDYYLAGRRAAVGVQSNKHESASVGAAARAWDLIKSTQQLMELEAFINRFPNNFYSDLAKARIDKLKNKQVAVIAPPSTTNLAEALVHDCDRLAAYPYDVRKVAPGVRFEALRAKDAIEACGKAIETKPNVARFAYQLARAFRKDKNYTEALWWYRTAAKQGHPEATTTVGDFHQIGQGIDQDFREAERWYRKAIAMGNAAAMFSLGQLYANGEGVARDEQEAVRWIRKAVEKGSPQAMFILGQKFEHGDGVPKDLAKAAYWYEKAAKHYVTGAAARRLAKMYDEGRGVPRDSKKAALVYFSTLENANPYAIREMTTEAGLWTEPFRIELQRLMKKSGAFAGNIDGRFGPDTRRAIESFAQ